MIARYVTYFLVLISVAALRPWSDPAQDASSPTVVRLTESQKRFDDWASRESDSVEDVGMPLPRGVKVIPDLQYEDDEKKEIIKKIEQAEKVMVDEFVSFELEENDLEHWEGSHLVAVIVGLLLQTAICLPCYWFCLRYKRAPDETFAFGLFACWGDANITFWALCCPFIRWADTVSKEKGGLLGFYAGFAIMLLLFLVRSLGGIGYLIGAFVISLLGTYYRQGLRQQYGLSHGCGSKLVDFCTWCLCPLCAIIQEARHVEWIEETIEYSELNDTGLPGDNVTREPPSMQVMHAARQGEVGTGGGEQAGAATTSPPPAAS